MKVKIMAILMLIAVSCQKEKMPEQQAQNANAVIESSATASQLLNDPNFVKLYNISVPIFNALREGRTDLVELYNDMQVYSNECRTLAPKLGFKDSAALAKYFQQVDVLAPKLQRRIRI